MSKRRYDTREAGSVATLSMAVLFLAACQSSAGEQEAIADACNGALNVPEAVCTCIAGAAMDKFNEQQREFFLAMLKKDDATTARLRGQMPVPELLETSMFLVNQTPECAGG